jgi:hypothetical protein
METKKITNKLALEYVMNNFDIPTDVLEKLEKMHDSLNRKSASTSGNRKPTAKQVENAQYKEAIVAFMGNEPNRIFTATEIQHGCPNLPEEISNQKTSALLNQLVNLGNLEKFKEKGKTFFRFVTATVTTEEEDAEGR